MYALRFSLKFKKQLGKLPDKIEKAFWAKLKLLVNNPKHNSLHTEVNYSASGHYDLKVFESRINSKHRFLWTYETERIIILLTVGNHNALEKAH